MQICHYRSREKRHYFAVVSFNAPNISSPPRDGFWLARSRHCSRQRRHFSRRTFTDGANYSKRVRRIIE
jgi:hypothetical protein